MRSFNWRSALQGSNAVEEFPPPGGGTWSQTQAEIDAAKNRPTEDQDLEDTAKPTKQAGQIDGDTTTLSGQAKPGQNPVPDKEDTRGGGEPKINSAPVDLADVVLTNQDRRAYQPLVSDAASKDAVNEQNIAQESGLFERIKDSFQHQEKSILEERAEARENLSRIEGMKTKLQTRQGDVHEKSDTIRLSAYATWLAIDGKVMDTEADLMRELARLQEFSRWFTSSYAKSLFDTYEYMATKVLKLGESNLPEAKANLAKVFEIYKPEGMEKYLTEKKTVEDKGQSYTDMESPMFMGSWRVVAYEQVKTNLAQGHELTFRWEKANDKVKKAELKPLSKQAMLKVVGQLEAISNVMAAFSAEAEFKKAVRFYDALDEFAYRYRYFKQLPREEQAMVQSIYQICNMVAEGVRMWFAERAVNHTVKATLLYVEKSMRRIK
jgi:hypothetical protein